jgi:hypothetical protein
VISILNSSSRRKENFLSKMLTSKRKNKSNTQRERTPNRSSKSKNDSKRMKEEVVTLHHSQHKKTDFLTQPTVILQKIFLFLPSKETIKMFQLNKSFSKCAECLPLYPQVGLSQDAFMQYLAHRQNLNLEGVILHLHEPSSLEFLHPHSTNLQRMLISSSHASPLNLEALKVCTKLRDVHLNGLFTSLKPLVSCSLVKITFFSVNVEDNFTTLQECKSLTEVCIECVSDTTRLLEAVSHLPLLEKLTVIGSHNLKSLPSLSECVSLTDLSINSSAELRDISGICGLKSLKYFYFCCSRLTMDFQIIGTCTNLESLFLENSKYMTDLCVDFLGTLPRLRTLKIVCYNLNPILCLKGCLSLEELHLEKVVVEEVILPDIGIPNIYGKLSGLKSIKLISCNPQIKSNYSSVEEILIECSDFPNFRLIGWNNLVSISLTNTVI